MPLLANKKSSSQEDSSKEDTFMNTSNWHWLQERFQMTDYELSKIMVRMPQLCSLWIFQYWKIGQHGFKIASRRTIGNLVPWFNVPLIF
jgi:hypothetical protein